MTTDVELTVQGLLRTYREAALAKDVEAFIAIYDENIEVFDAWGPPWLLSRPRVLENDGGAMVWQPRGQAGTR